MQKHELLNNTNRENCVLLNSVQEFIEIGTVYMR